jgi:hypothetical protein
MIPYNHKKRTYSLQKDVINLIIKAASPTLWMYFIQDDSVPNNTFHYSKIIQADSLEEAKKKILYSNISYLLKIKKFKMTISFANEIVDFTCNDCRDCINFLNILNILQLKTIHLNDEKTIFHKNELLKNTNLYFEPFYDINYPCRYMIPCICSKHFPTNEQLLYILEKCGSNLRIDDCFIMVDYFSYGESKIALRKIEYD